MSLYRKLLENESSGMLPLHMPGHKRNALFGGKLPLGLDITEIEGFDDLHCPAGILKDLCEKMAALRNAETAIPSVGGSTAGILASVTALTAPGDRVVLSAACHKSVYHALLVNDLRPYYIYPETDEKNGFPLSVSPDAVEAALEESGAKLVIITCPTYEGVTSDIKAIAEAAHRHGAKLLTDAAHGAHLGFSPAFPPSAISQGADVSVESLHKTLPALTQCAAIYLNKGIDPAPFRQAMGIFETSSPSYILLSSMDKCTDILSEKKAELFVAYEENLATFRNKTAGLKHLTLTGCTSPVRSFGFDPCKIIISTAGTDITGPALAEKLRKDYKIEPEMVSLNYVLCLMSICDTAESFERLSVALTEIDGTLGPGDTPAVSCVPAPFRSVISPRKALSMPCEYVPLEEAAGRISLTYIWAYPPGIPMIIPGAEISPALTGTLVKLRENGINILQEGENSTDLLKVAVRDD